MPYQAQATEGTEPISDTVWEMVANQSKYNVVSGCDVTLDTGNMTVDVASGTVTHNGVSVAVSEQLNVVTLVADSSSPRFAWVGINSGGTAVLVTGDASADPVVPELGDNVALSLILIPANETLASNCTDIEKRIPALVVTPPSLPVLLADLRDNKALLALVDQLPTSNPNTQTYAGIGLNAAKDGSGSIPMVAGVGGHFDLRSGTTADSQAAVASSGGGVAPAHGARNPYAAFILTSAAAAAAIKAQGWGFYDSSAISTWTTTTRHKAFFRSVTTGALFAVTGNASAEETTSLSASHTLGTAGVFEVFTEDDGVTWKFKIGGVEVASHATQVPGADTGMEVVAGIENNTTTNVQIDDIDLIYAYQDRS